MRKRSFDMKQKIFIIVFASIPTFLILSGCAHKTAKTVSLSPYITGDSTPVQRPEEFSSTAVPLEAEDTGDAFSEIEDEFEKQYVEVNDPLEPLNRGVFYVNDKLYFWAIKPLAQGYNFVLPDFARKGVRNFFTNLSMPIRLTNCILQGKATSAGTEFVRFVTNTTIGILGVWDPAMC